MSRAIRTFSKKPGENEVAVEVVCPLCGSNVPKPLWDFKSHRYVKCKSCTMVYQNPRPEPEDLIDRYDEEYFQYEIENEAQFLRLMKFGLEDLSFQDTAESAGFTSILDIGCATGLLLSDLARQGWEVQGVEVCAEAAQYGEKERGVPIFIGVLKDFLKRHRKFDVVHCSHVIEHVPEPSAFFSQIAQSLNQNGILYMTTPNIGSLQGVLFGKNWRSVIPDHVQLFSRKTLLALSEKAGFELINWKSWGGLPAGSAPHWLKNPIDKIAKIMGWGDVVIMAFRLKQKS